MKQLLKIYGAIYNALEFRHQASNSTLSFDEFVLDELVQSIHLSDDRFNQAAAELYQSVRRDDLRDVLVDSTIDFNEEKIDVNQQLCKRLLSYDENTLSDTSFGSVLKGMKFHFLKWIGKSKPAKLIDFPEFIKEVNQRKASNHYMLEYTRMLVFIIMSGFIIGSMDYDKLTAYSHLETILNEFGFIVISMMLLTIITPQVHHKTMLGLTKLSLGAGVLIGVGYQLDLLSINQRYLLVMDYMRFFHLITIVLLMLFIVELFSRLFSAKDSIKVEEADYVDGKPFVLYKNGDAFAGVHELHMSVNKPKGFERAVTF